MSYMTISSQENKIFHSVHAFTHIRQHYFSKYWGGPMHGRSPHLKFWGTVPPVPLGLRPWAVVMDNIRLYSANNNPPFIPNNVSIVEGAELVKIEVLKKVCRFSNF